MKTAATASTPSRKTPVARGRRGTRRDSLLDLLKDFDGLATDLPSDFASQHDHYLYGTPKRATR